jgi:hypothetical protein
MESRPLWKKSRLLMDRIPLVYDKNHGAFMSNDALSMAKIRVVAQSRASPRRRDYSDIDRASGRLTPAGKIEGDLE